MLFHSQFYLLGFLPIAAVIYYLLANSVTGRQWFLIAVSLVFYGWFDARLVALPVTQISVSWLLSRLHERLGSRAPLIVGVVLNLLSLATFKYLDFLLA